MRTHKRIVMFVGIGVCLGLVLWFGFLAKSIRAYQAGTARLSKAPRIESCVQHVTLVKAELVNRGAHQEVELELRNDAYIGIVALAIETTVGKEQHKVIASGFSPDQPPVVILQPQGMKKFSIGNLSQDSPIKIASVTFSDGTEEGCEDGLKTMRQVNELNKKRGREK
jgi:hypothetical protein